MKDSNPIVYGVVGFVLGGVISIWLAQTAVNNQMQGMMRMMGMRVGAGMTAQQETGMGMGSSMNEMMESMMGKSGDEFDKAFLESMMVHHQGAVAMAEKAQMNAKHMEVKNMAKDISEAQTREIEQMERWQEMWGY